MCRGWSLEGVARQRAGNANSRGAGSQCVIIPLTFGFSLLYAPSLLHFDEGAVGSLLVEAARHPESRDFQMPFTVPKKIDSPERASRHIFVSASVDHCTEPPLWGADQDVGVEASCRQASPGRAALLSGCGYCSTAATKNDLVRESVHGEFAVLVLSAFRSPDRRSEMAFHGRNSPSAATPFRRGISSMHGIDVTSDSVKAVEQYDAAVSEYLGLTGDPVGKLEAALEADPGFTLAHLLLALLHLLSGGATGADPIVARMRRRASILVEGGHCNHRERVMLAATNAWAEGRQREAAAVWEAWLLEQPVDALTIRLLHDTYYFLGDAANLRDSVGRVLPAWEVAHPEYLKVCGMFAFGAEECGSYALAEDQGMRALGEDSADPWALHAVVHVYDALGRRYEGQRLLRETRWFWDAANLMHVHLHWHWGLFQLEEGQFERAFVRYDWWLREYHAGTILDIVDSASLLWRLELCGNPVYDRWEELAPLTEQYQGQHSTPFNDVHIAMVLAGAGRESELQAHLDSMRAAAYSSPFYSPTHSVSDPALASPVARHPVDDLGWDWGLVPRATPAGAPTNPPANHAGTSATAPATMGQAPSTLSEQAVLEAAEDALMAEVLTHGRQADSPSGALAQVGGNGQVAVSSGVASAQDVGHFPPSVGDPSQYDLTAPPADSPLADPPSAATGHSDLVQSAEDDAGIARAEDPFSLSAETARGAGGRLPRPVLTAPFSTLPVLPLRGASPPQGEGEGGSTPPDLVSLGGVGGFGLGSHSVHDMRYVAAAVGVPLAEGMAAYRLGDYATAVDKLLPLRNVWHHIGGSAAQRDVFAQTLEAAATQSRQLLLARALLRERITNKPNGAMAMFHLSSILFSTGESKTASQMRDRALRFGLGQERVSTPQRNALTKTEDAWYQ